MPRKRKDLIENGRIGKEKPQQRNAANARERARMRILSRAFSRLKTTLPWVPADTKLSKLDTLRLATSYIAHLRTLLCDDNSSLKPQTSHPIALTWPFSFNKGSDSRDISTQPSNHCDSYTQFNQHQSIFSPAIGPNHNSNNNNNNISHNHNHLQNSNPTINRYYGEDMQDYEYYSPDIFQM